MTQGHRRPVGHWLLVASLLGLTGVLASCGGGGSSGASAGGNWTQPAAYVADPVITAVIPSSIAAGRPVTLTGSAFGSAQIDTSRVFFSSDGIRADLDAGPVESVTDWSDGKIRIAVPSLAVTGPVQVVLRYRTSSQRRSNDMAISVKRGYKPEEAPKLAYVSPSQGQFVGADAPVTLIFDKPILPSTMTVNAVSLSSVAIPNASPREGWGECEDRPTVCDLRTGDLIQCTCRVTQTVTAVTDISASMRAVPQTAWLIQHVPFDRGYGTILISVNGTVRADGSLDENGEPRTLPGPNAQSPGEWRFFFVR